MVRKSFSLSIGLPHSGHSGGVSGKESSSMVSSTSTNGTSATMPAKSSPARLATAHQHAACAAAMSDDAPAARIVRRDQRACAGCKIVKTVGLLLALAVEIPAPALVGAPSDMGDRI